MSAFAIALFRTEKAEAPQLFIGVSGMDCVNKVKQFFKDCFEVHLHAEPASLTVFNKVGTFKELKDWMEAHYCSYDVVMEYDALK